VNLALPEDVTLSHNSVKIIRTDLLNEAKANSLDKFNEFLHVRKSTRDLCDFQQPADWTVRRSVGKKREEPDSLALENSVGLLDTVDPIEAHETKRTDTYIHHLTPLITRSAWEGNFLADIGLNDMLVVGNQIK
jgi:hypothetical protein